MDQPSQALLNAQQLLEQYRRRDGVAYQPTFSGAADTSWLATLAAAVVAETAVAEPAPAEPASTVMRRDGLMIHPDVAVASMRANEAPHFQLWLLLRLMDAEGRGYLPAADLQMHLATLASRWRQYNPARLQQIMKQGHGRYWSFDGRRVWLRRLAAVAAGLGLEGLSGRMVGLKREQVTVNVGLFKAHCFAAWLGNHPNPMSQRTIEELTGIPPRSQRRYCELAKVRVQENICIGPRLTAESRELSYWNHAGAFEFTDYAGKQGPAGRRYMAWHLPSGYDPAAQTGSRSQQRRLAQQHLVDLAKHGALGNGLVFARQRLTRRFYANGSAAAKVINRGADGDIYWRQDTARRHPKRGLWLVFQGAAMVGWRPTATSQ